MKTKYLLIAGALLISLFIYLFYRTDRTLVNEVAIRVMSQKSYLHLKAAIVRALPLHTLLIYSLPEGLWILCITLTSRPYYINLFHRRVDCVIIPLLFCITLELFQLVHLTNGRFDWWDIALSTMFWILGGHVINDRTEKENLFYRLNFPIVVCVSSYGIVYLAHVFK